MMPKILEDGIVDRQTSFNWYNNISLVSSLRFYPPFQTSFKG